MKNENQQHLSYQEYVNLGSYYTPNEIVEIVYEMLQKNISNIRNFTAFDSSCGYGAFLKSNLFKKNIGADIDSEAIKVAQKNKTIAKLWTANTLSGTARKTFGISDDDKLILIGNPPYNDKTSIIRNEIKNITFDIDRDLESRDLGISFLLSYDKLKADYVAVLHPLSYLIKKTNFNSLKQFKDNYVLIDSLVFNSQKFSNASKTMGFPIIIALYKRQSGGMCYEDIYNYNFKTIEEKSFSLSSFDSISNYITKYPNKKYTQKSDAICYFWTMRDINALRRSRTFIDKDDYNTIYVKKEDFDYYCYVDVFKLFVKKVPYYLGNLDVFINNKLFLENREIFRKISLSNNEVLKQKYNKEITINDEDRFKIKNYFEEILKEHYANN